MARSRNLVGHSTIYMHPHGFGPPPKWSLSETLPTIHFGDLSPVIPLDNHEYFPKFLQSRNNNYQVDHGQILTPVFCRIKKIYPMVVYEDHKQNNFLMKRSQKNCSSHYIKGSYSSFMAAFIRPLPPPRRCNSPTTIYEFWYCHWTEMLTNFLWRSTHASGSVTWLGSERANQGRK